MFMIVIGIGGWFAMGILAWVIIYSIFLKPWFLVWGANPDEVRRYMPGDELIPNPGMVSTRSIDIRSTPGKIWPWLVQIGQDKGGFYSYAWLENMMGLNIQNANEIIPEYQSLKEGDIVKFHAGGGLMVTAIEPGKTLVLCGFKNERDHPDMKDLPLVDATWVFMLNFVHEDLTRLTVRLRMTWNPGILNTIAYKLMLEPVHFIMERKMLLGIKKRAEKVPFIHQDN